MLTHKQQKIIENVLYIETTLGMFREDFRGAMQAFENYTSGVEYRLRCTYVVAFFIDFSVWLFVLGTYGAL